MMEDCYLHFNALIQAKKIHDGAFIGFLGERPSKKELRTRRAFCSGRPHFGVFERSDGRESILFRRDSVGAQMVFQGDDFAALDRFGAPPFCIQWCVARRNKKDKELIADHPQPFWEDLSVLVRAKRYAARDFTVQELAREEPTDVVESHFSFPTLVLDGPIYTCAVGNGALKRVERITLSTIVDTVDGATEDYVDVVTLKGLDALVRDYKAAVSNIVQVFPSGLPTRLTAISREQHADWKRRRTRA